MIMPTHDTNLPYFPLYVNDFASSGRVEAMTTTAVGAYILLLCKAWHEKPPASVPNNDSILARWARLNEAEWAICKPLVLSAFTLRKDNRWHQKRLREEYDKLQRYFQTRSNSGKKGAENRWHKPQEDNGLNGTAITNPITKNSNSKSKSKSKTDNTPPYPPEGGLCAGLNTQESKPPEPPKPKGRPDYYTDEGQKRRAIALSILHEVNERCGKHFPDHYAAGLAAIKDRLIEGRTHDEFSRIIEVKLHDPLFQQKPNLYDPRTLFAADKFDTYLNQDPDGWNSNKGKPTPKSEKAKSSPYICDRCHQGLFNCECGDAMICPDCGEHVKMCKCDRERRTV
jgi:uncharacterized phage protein (TIGR02220 family)